MDGRREHGVLLEEISRRGFLQRAGALGLGAVVLSAVPTARKAEAQVPVLGDANLQAFADTMIPGPRVRSRPTRSPCTAIRWWASTRSSPPF